MSQNRATTYGVLAVSHIAQKQADGHESGIVAKDVAETFGLPTAYAAKVMSQLARARILRSVRGPRGGFVLAQDAKDITVCQVVEAIDGSIDGAADVADTAMPDALKQVFAEASEARREKLDSMTIADGIGTKKTKKSKQKAAAE